MRPVIFDTDIGTDVDDILALVLLAKAPELKLLGVTTVYGDTLFRARIAAATLQRLGRTDIEILRGEQKTLSGRQIHWAGHEGEGMSGFETIEIRGDLSGSEYIIEKAEELQGNLEVAATGPLTNVAKAILMAPASCAKIKHLYIMGGAFWLNRAEHNIKCDSAAARIVFQSDIPITVIGLDLTLRVWLGASGVAKIAGLPNGLGPLLENQIFRWWEYRHMDCSNPHDPVAVLAMVRPDLFVFENWDVEIEDRETAPGFTLISNQGSGKIRIGADLLAETAGKEVVSRIVAA